MKWPLSRDLIGSHSDTVDFDWLECTELSNCDKESLGIGRSVVVQLVVLEKSWRSSSIQWFDLVQVDPRRGLRDHHFRLDSVLYSPRTTKQYVHSDLTNLSWLGFSSLETDDGYDVLLDYRPKEEVDPSPIYLRVVVSNMNTRTFGTQLPMDDLSSCSIDCRYYDRCIAQSHCLTARLVL